MSGTLAPSTPTNRRIAGLTAMSINGSAFAVTEFAWSPGIVKRETMESLSGIDGYRERPRTAYISGKLRDGGAVSVTGFTQLYNATVVLQLANGKQIVGHGLWNTGESEVSGEDATFDFKFEGVAGTIQEIGVG